MLEMNLTAQQVRVIGCLLEKEITTPDQYPLSLNGLTVACNQKSNREPVLALTETEVQGALDQLKEKRLIREESGLGNRVVKYKHRFCNTEFSDLQLPKSQLAIICVLFLRGTQTPGELRNRCNRLHEFASVTEVEESLVGLSQRESGSLVQCLAREPGKRESRYAHLFSGDIDPSLTALSPTVELGSSDNALEIRVTALEQEVAELKVQLSSLLDTQ